MEDEQNTVKPIEAVEAAPKKRGRPPKVKRYRYTGRARIHTSVGRFTTGAEVELPEAELTADWVLV